MTLATIPTRHDFTGNGSATSFSYTLKITDQDYIKLVHTDTAGVENSLADPLVVDTDYTVSNIGVTGGGTVEFPKAGSLYSTLASGEKLSIIYDFPLAQTTDLPNTGRVFNESVEDQLDYVTVLINQNKEKLDRSLKLVDGSTLTDVTFPESTSASSRAGKLARWNTAGTNLELVAIASVGNVDPIAVQGDIVQGDASGDAAKLAIGGTGAMLQVSSGLLEYLSVGATSAVYQVVAGKIASVTNPILLLPTIADFTNATHDHTDAAGGGDIFISPTIVTPTIASFTNATHDHSDAAGGGSVGDIQASSLTLTGTTETDTNTLVKGNIVKAWGHITTSGGTVTEENLFNVSSVTDNGVGDFTFVWDTDFANATYAVAALSVDNGGATDVTRIHTMAAGSTRFNVNFSTSPFSAVDPPLFTVIAIGDQ